MPRLFITPRELDFISDLTKEVTKDIIGAKIFLYSVREDLTDIHDVYEESREKIFNPPLELEALVTWQPETVTTDRYGFESKSKIEVYLHARDLLDKDIDVKEGDFFSYGTTFFEITSIITDKEMFGQVEHVTGFKLMGTQAREGQINFQPLGPLDKQYEGIEPNAVQKEFVQQRGFDKNSLGPTNDVRQLQKDGKLEKPEKPAEVKEDGISSSFYTD